MIPVPGASIGTPYGKRGPYWSCSPDAAGHGKHTGVDYPAAAGSAVVAARAGTVHHCHHGDAFGAHQIEITPGDGTRDFYAHMSRRVGNGVKVSAGEWVGDVGSEGNATGPHLHFERHTVASGGWSCAIITDPKPSIDHGGDWRASGDVYVSKLHKGQQDSDSVARLRYRLEHHKHMPGTHKPGYGKGYGQECLEAVRYWQRNLDPQREAASSGPKDGTHMPAGQANRLFGDKYTVIDDT
jgi:hypothetical protein